MNDDYIRTFLESPKSLELIPEKAIGLKRKNATKPAKKKERLPPYNPYKSIFERNDFSNMTERQILMSMKFKTIAQNASSLFLAVNDIYFNGVKKNKSSFENIESNSKCKKFQMDIKNKNDSVKTEKKIKESFIKHQNKQYNNMNFLIRLKGSNNKEQTSSFDNIIRMPFFHKVDCIKCTESIEDLLQFLSWLIKEHRCKFNSRFRNAQKSVALAIGNQKCVCDSESELFKNVWELQNMDCNCL